MLMVDQKLLLCLNEIEKYASVPITKHRHHV